MKKTGHKKIQKTVVIAICSFLLWGIVSVVDTLQTVRLPRSEFPAELYSNHTYDDLRLTFSKAMEGAQDSILLIMYALTDPHIIHTLKKRADDGIQVTVIHDADASPQIAKKLGPKVKVFKRKTPGLMHQKILVIDHVQTWIGSANMTTDSLRKHGNLITAIHAQSIADRIFEKSEALMSKKKCDPLYHQHFSIGPQTLELWFLPDDPLAPKRIVEMINSAKKTIRIAMFTWTRQDFAQAVIAAHQRGVNVEVVVDQHAGKGAGSGVVLALCHAGVPVALSTGNALLHHKMAVIDNQFLINGSANWTKAAFTQNDDCFTIIYDLTEDQLKMLNQLWDVVALESVPQAA